jgi:hypothetical protein
MLHYVLWKMFTDLSGELTAFIINHPDDEGRKFV